MRKHKFSSKHVLIAAVLLMIWGLLSTEIPAGIAGYIAGLFMGLTDIENTGLDGCYFYVGIASLFAAFLVLLIHKWWFKPEFKGCLKIEKPDACIKLSAVYMIYLAAGVLEIYLFSGFTGVTCDGAGMALMAGICEETAFRALPVSLMLRYWNREDKILNVMWVSAVCFALSHALNAAAGASALMTVYQVFCCLGAGAFFAALFIRTGSILPCMLLHFMQDLLGSMDEGIGDSLLYSKTVFGGAQIIDCITCVILAACAIYFLRAEKREEIVSLLNSKWSKGSSF